MSQFGHHNHVERFLSNFDIVPSGCWEWQKHKDKDGYGKFNSKVICPYAGYRAHRLMWELVHNVSLSCNELVCHTCDNPSCVNPEHLYIGTQQTNREDMYNRNRRDLLFSDKDVERIRKIYINTPIVGSRKQEYATKLAKEYGVTHQQIDTIARGLYKSGGRRTIT